MCNFSCASAVVISSHRAVEVNSASNQPSTIDVSTDLTTLGIAQQNMLANNMSLDAGPLLEAAVNYANKHNINNINVPAGNYYFLSTRNNAHVFIANANNIHLQCNDATFNFSSRKASGIIVRNGKNIGIENVKLDFSLDLPFTSAIVGSVDIANNALNIHQVTGRPLSDFTSSSRYSVRVFVLRKTADGSVASVPVEWLLPIDGPLNNNQIVLKANNKLANNLSKIQAGDILCVSERSYAGCNALSFLTYPPDIDSGNYAKNVTIYSSPAIGLSSMWQTGLSFSGIKIEPKPGRVQYISSNADGINLVNSGLNNSVTNCLVVKTGDDGISLSGNLLAMVSTVNSDNSIVVNERYKIPSNQKITFVDPDDLHEITSATVLQSPDRTSVPHLTVLNLDANVSNLIKPGILVYLPQEQRSHGIKIQGNTIQYPFSRGIYLSGVDGAQIIGNTIEHTQSCGILAQAGRNIPSVTNAVISNNIINGAFEKGYTDQPGAIEMSVEGRPTSALLNKNMVISNNKITIGGTNIKHVGIYITNTKGYNLTGNSSELERQDGTVIKLPSVRGTVIGTAVTSN